MVTAKQFVSAVPEQQHGHGIATCQLRHGGYRDSCDVGDWTVAI